MKNKITITDYLLFKEFLNESGGVESFFDTLSEAVIYINSLFDNPDLEIKPASDPEDDGGSNWICVEIIYDKEDFEEMMDKFDDLWYFNNFKKFKIHVCFSVKKH